jgi:hypothetical protein
MLGYHAKKNLWFCDLQCIGCQGNTKNPCIVVGMFSLWRAQVVCWKNNIFLENFMRPKDDCFWSKVNIGTAENYPINEYPVYDFEVIH